MKRRKVLESSDSESTKSSEPAEDIEKSLEEKKKALDRARRSKRLADIKGPVIHPDRVRLIKIQPRLIEEEADESETTASGTKSADESNADQLITDAVELREEVISGWLEKADKSRVMKLRGIAEQIYDIITALPERLDIIASKMPLKEKCALIEQMDILEHCNPGTEEFFVTKKEIFRILSSYENMKETEADIQGFEATEAKLKPVDSDVPLKIKILKAPVSERNKKIILEKHDAMQKMLMFDSGRAKLSEWIDWAMSIADTQVPSGVQLSDGALAINKYLHSIRVYLDKHLYGMVNAKEELLELLAMRITNPQSKEMSIGLLGSPGVGKCLHPDTGVLVYGGGIKKASEIIVGDQLIGDDGQARHVLSVNSGMDIMYTITLSNGYEFTVNSCHVLSLMKHNKIVDIQLDEFMKKDLDHQAFYSMFSVAVQYPEAKLAVDPYIFGNVEMAHRIEIPSEYLYSSKRQRFYLLQGLARRYDAGALMNHIDSVILYRKKNKFDTTVNTVLHVAGEKIRHQILWLCTSLGLKTWCEAENISIVGGIGKRPPENPEPILYSFRVTQQPAGRYCGMTLTGNGRFLLDSCVVTHNTHLVQVFAEAVGMPYYKINMGGSVDPSYFLGHAYTYEGAQPGVIVKALRQMQSKSGVIYLDEFDKLESVDGYVSANASKVAHTFLHISDPVQQKNFTDQYMPEIQIDISNITFIYSFNDERGINPILRNRIPIIKIEGYSAKDKFIIIRDYIIPSMLKNVGLNNEKVIFDDSLLHFIINETRDADRDGIRTVKHIIKDICKRVNIIIATSHADGELFLSYGMKDLKFPIVVDKKLFERLKIKIDKPRIPPGLYT